jgi:hypothetical protein
MADGVVSARVELDPVVVDEVLNDPQGPVGDLLDEISDRMLRIAQRRAPVRGFGPPTVWNEATTSASAPGDLLASLHPVVRKDSRGKLFGGINAQFYPTVFLEYPRQDRVPHPVLTYALWHVTWVTG